MHVDKGWKQLRLIPSPARNSHCYAHRLIIVTTVNNWLYPGNKYSYSYSYSHRIPAGGTEGYFNDLHNGHPVTLYLWTTDSAISCLLGFLQSQFHQASGTGQKLRVCLCRTASCSPCSSRWLLEPRFHDLLRRCTATVFFKDQKRYIYSTMNDW